MTAYWLSLPSCWAAVDGVEERVGVGLVSRDSSRHGSDGAPITAPVPSIKDTQRTEPFTRNILPRKRTGLDMTSSGYWAQMALVAPTNGK